QGHEAELFELALKQGHEAELFELALKQGHEAELFELARELTHALAAQLALKRKSERGYELLEGSEAAHAKAAPIDLDGDVPEASKPTLDAVHKHASRRTAIWA